MGDAADILGVQKSKPAANDPLSIMTGADKVAAPSKPDKMKKPKGMSREVFNLMGKDGIAPSIQTNADPKNAGFKNKRQSSTQGKWVWTEYQSSARSDSQPFFHWVKADLQAFDYVYAKFNTKQDAITYTNDEYESLLKVSSWTRSETDQLMSMCHEYNLRWPVIADRFETTCHRSTEDLMARYYFVTTKLKASRNEKRGGNFSNQVVPSSIFDVEYERCRRKQQDLMMKMTPAEQAEEAALREELKGLDASIKKIKKSLKQAAPPPPQAPTGTKATPTAPSKKKGSAKDSSSSATLLPSTAASIAAASVGGSVAAAVLLKPQPPIVMYGGVMTPAPGQPCLQSARLAFSNDVPDFSKKVVTGFEGTSNLDLSEPFIAKLKHFSQELGMPDKLLPTRAVCDLNDQIRKDMAILLTLQSKIARNEEKISSIREQNPHINAVAFGGISSGSRGGSSAASGRAPECRVAVPDSAYLVKDSDGSGQGLPVMKPYVPAAPLVLVPPPPLPVEKHGAGDKEKGGTASKASKSGAGGADAAGKTTKKTSKAKRKAGEISKEVTSPTSAKQSPVVPESKPKTKPPAAASKPAVKKINPVLAKAATIPIPALNNTPQSIAIAAAANAVKAKLAAEQKAASEGNLNPAGSLLSGTDKVADPGASRAISAAVKAVASGVSTATTSATVPSLHSQPAPSSSSEGADSSLEVAQKSASSTALPPTEPLPTPTPITFAKLHSAPTPADISSTGSSSSTGMVSAIDSASALLSTSVTEKRSADDGSDESSEPSVKKAKPN